jgi:hypothetical protein
MDLSEYELPEREAAFDYLEKVLHLQIKPKSHPVVKAALEQVRIARCIRDIHF